MKSRSSNKEKVMKKVYIIREIDSDLYFSKIDEENTKFDDDVESIIKFNSHQEALDRLEGEMVQAQGFDDIDKLIFEIVPVYVK